MIVRIVSPLVNAFPHQARIPSSSAKLLSPLAINWLISRTAERFREMTADDGDDLGDAYRDIGTAYRNKDRRDARAIKKAAKETAREYKKFGKQVADIYRDSEEK